MKNKKDNTILSFQEKNIRIYSEETKHLFSKEDQSLFENFDKKMPKFSKYLVWQKKEVIEKTLIILKQKPELPIKQVIIKVLTTLPDFLPAENLLKVVGYITKTWEDCQQKSLKKAS